MLNIVLVIRTIKGSNGYYGSWVHSRNTSQAPIKISKSMKATLFNEEQAKITDCISKWKL